MIKLQNDSISIAIQKHGAELSSLKLKKDNLEFLWQADPIFWGRHAPILFPIVGMLNNNETSIKGQKYKMTQHGFARDMDFSLIKQTHEIASFELTSSNASKEKYPYDFVFQIHYQIQENQLKVSYEVINPSREIIHFSLGAHPAFNWPLEKEYQKEDYSMSFNKKETCSRLLFADGTLTGEDSPYLTDDDKIPLHDKTFEDDAIIFEGLTSDEIEYSSPKSNHKLVVNYKNFPYLGIWSKPSGAPFVCIEPWYGLADVCNSNGIFEEKKGIQELAPEGTHKSQITYTIQ